MDVTRSTYYAILTYDRPGELARFAKKMSEENIHLDGVWGFGIGHGNAEIMAIPRDPDAFKKAIQNAGWAVREGSCFHLTGEDRAGALAETLDRISQEGINLHAVDGMGFEGRYSAYVWCDDSEVENLRKILKGW